MKYLENGEFRWLEDHYDIPAGFHPTGSRWVGGWHNESDYDYFAYNTDSVKQFIERETEFREMAHESDSLYSYGNTFSEEKPIQSYRLDDINFIVYFEKWAYEKYVVANELAKIRGAFGWQDRDERIEFFERYTWNHQGVKPAVVEEEIPKILLEMQEKYNVQNLVSC